MAPKTTLALLKNFNELYPECMIYLDKLRFVEQYDPNDESIEASSGQPFAYVADMVEEIKLGVEIEDIRGRGLNNDQWTAIMELRDKIAPDEKVGWYVVVCGDEERYAPPTSDSTEGSENSVAASPPAQRDSPPPGPAPGNAQLPPAEKPEPKGFKKFFSMRSRSKR